MKRSIHSPHLSGNGSTATQYPNTRGKNPSTKRQVKKATFFKVRMKRFMTSQILGYFIIMLNKMWVLPAGTCFFKYFKCSASGLISCCSAAIMWTQSPHTPSCWTHTLNVSSCWLTSYSIIPHKRLQLSLKIRDVLNLKYVLQLL